MSVLSLNAYWIGLDCIWHLHIDSLFIDRCVDVADNYWVNKNSVDGYLLVDLLRIMLNNFKRLKDHLLPLMSLYLLANLLIVILCF